MIVLLMDSNCNNLKMKPTIRFSQLPTNSQTYIPSHLRLNIEDYDEPPDSITGRGEVNLERDFPERWHPLKKKALAKFIDVTNLDLFLERAYHYFQGKGVYAIALTRICDILTFLFLIILITFLSSCIDYSKLEPQNHFPDVVVPHCFSNLSIFNSLFLLLSLGAWIWQTLSFGYELQPLVEMYDFYSYVLEISDSNLQTVEWNEVVTRILKVRDELPHLHPSLRRLNEHDIAIRILRRENYLIALFNKDILNLTVPIPFLKNYPFLTKTMEWNLHYCIISYIFDETNSVKRSFLQESQKRNLVDGLRQRFIYTGILNIILSPFILMVLVVYFCLKHGEEYHKNPSLLGTRQYSAIARWKFREFNELNHLFIKRLNRSYPKAINYMAQFPSEKTAIIARFVSFIAGSFAGILAMMTLLGQELLLGFELTPGKTVFFYIGVFGSILAVSRGMIPDENVVFDPKNAMKEVILDTHFFPAEWKHKLHTDQVKKEIGSLFQYKVILLLEEVFSIIVTPFILWLSLPPCSVDFFREFTVHVDSVGYVCSFAVFDFKRHGNIKYGAPHGISNRHLISADGKMERSFLYFKENNPKWKPDEEGSLYLSKIQEFGQQTNGEGSFYRKAASPVRSTIHSPGTSTFESYNGRYEDDNHMEGASNDIGLTESVESTSSITPPKPPIIARQDRHLNLRTSRVQERDEPFISPTEDYSRKSSSRIGDNMENNGLLSVFYEYYDKNT